MSKYIHTLLATLGGQPQVVTFTLDLLLQRGFPISEVILVHPEASHPRLQHSLDCLNAEFVGATPGYPHELVIDLGSPRPIEGLLYVPRQDSSNGRVKDYEVRVSKDGQTVDARSIMGLMMLAAGPGCCIDIEAEGAEAQAAVDALATLVEGRFDEDE